MDSNAVKTLGWFEKLLALALLLGCWGIPLGAEESTPPPSRRELIDALSDEEVERAISAVREGYLDPQVAGDAALRRAALEGLIVRLGESLELVPPGVGEPGEPFPFLAEILDSHIAYVRPGVVNSATLGQFKATLEGFEGKPVDALLLDLRLASGDFEAAAEFARLLCPKGRLLFTLERPSAKQERLFTSNLNPVFQGVVVVLTDSRTRGGAEALAATLRANLGAMLVGSDTAGAAVDFQEIPLGAESSLRIAVSRVTVPGIPELHPAGLKPDIPISLPRDLQQRIFQQSMDKGVGPFVFETGRTRLDEASLVANTNPEIDFVRDQQNREPGPPPLRDTVLQRAVDLATAILFYSKDKP